MRGVAQVSAPRKEQSPGLREIEGLDRVAGASHISDLARLAAGAAYEGVDAEQWRAWVRQALGGDRGEVVLRADEHCMRSNGLWPWSS